MNYSFTNATPAEAASLPGGGTISALLNDHTYARVIQIKADDVPTGWYYSQLADGRFSFECYLDSITHSLEIVVQQLARVCLEKSRPASQRSAPLETPKEVADYIGAACEYCMEEPLAHSDHGRPIYAPTMPTLPPGPYTLRNIMQKEDEYPTEVWVQDGTQTPWTIGDYKCMVPICPKHNKEFETRILSDEEAARYT